MTKRYSAIKFIIAILSFVASSVLICGCASGPNGSANPGTRVLKMTLKVSDAGQIDTSGCGFYAILLSNTAGPIEVTNYETYTDYIRFDGYNFNWFHRQENVPGPGYTWINAGNINDTARIESDGKAIVIRHDLLDSLSLFNQYIQANTFSAHVLTTDCSNALLGRAIDTLGAGPTLDQNALYTVTFDRFFGLKDPAPPGYPFDLLNDWNEKPDLGNFPYVNYDIEQFIMELED